MTTNQQKTIPIEDICKKIFKETVLDIFYLIMEHKDISKREISQRFQESNGIDEGKSQKYRNAINEAISKLEGALFIDSWKDGTPGAPIRYYLTTHGESAREILEKMFEEDSQTILRGTRIVSKAFEGSVK